MARLTENIDIIFRNGLKNIEVLPPASAWDKVSQSVSRTGRVWSAGSVAAVFALLISASAIGYTLTDIIGNSGLAPQILAEQPSYNPRNAELAFNTLYPAGAEDVNSVAEVQDLQSRVSTQQNINEMPEAIPVDYYSDFSTPDLSGDQFQEARDISRLLSSQAFSYSSVPEYVELKQKRNKDLNRWSIGALVSPSFFVNNGSAGADLTPTGAVLEDAMVSYSGGVAFTFAINNRFTVQSGVSYSTVGHSIGGLSVFSGFFRHAGTKSGALFDVATSHGTIVTSNKDIFLIDYSGERVASSFASGTFDPYKANLDFIGNNLYQSFRYLEFPVTLRYKVIDRKFDLNLVGGLAYNVLIGNTAYTYADGSRINLGRTEELTPLTFSSSVGVGMEYSFSGNFTLNVEPLLRYYLNPFGTVTGSWENPYSFGLFSGIFYKF